MTHADQREKRFLRTHICCAMVVIQLFLNLILPNYPYNHPLSCLQRRFLDGRLSLVFHFGVAS
jgi:hypothetical protein